MRDYPKYTLQLPKLDFSPLHRLLSPTVAANLTADNQMGLQIPFDVFMVGDLASVDLPPPSSQPGVFKVGNQVDQRFQHAASDKPSEYFDPFFADSGLLSVFLRTMASEPAWKLISLATSSKLDFPSKNPVDVAAALAVGASFDPRLVVGTYQFTEPDNVANWIVFIDTLSDKPRVYRKCT